MVCPGPQGAKRDKRVKRRSDDGEDKRPEWTKTRGDTSRKRDFCVRDFSFTLEDALYFIQNKGRGDETGNPQPILEIIKAKRNTVRPRLRGGPIILQEQESF